MPDGVWCGGGGIQEGAGGDGEGGAGEAASKVGSRRQGNSSQTGGEEVCLHEGPDGVREGGHAMASLQLTANFLAPRCLSTGRHEMSTSTATSHTPAEGHAHILTVHSSHWREGEQWTDHVPALAAGGDGRETNRRRSSGREDAVEEGTRAHAHQQDLQGWRLVWGEGACVESQRQMVSTRGTHRIHCLRTTCTSSRKS